MALRAGSKLGPYEIIAPLGAGGMGEVYRARDTRLGREVAIKVLPPAFSSHADRLRRFEQEARATAALNHPNILAVFDTGATDGAPYVVSELLEGSTLRERLRSGALPVRKAIELAVQIANGLAAAHEKGILHRDLKPENLFLTRDGRIKILDFGLAKLTEPESRMHSAATAESGTDAGTVLGTLGYMSPEQVRGLPVDARSDIFSFGAVLYEMLSGKRAFHGATSADTISAILKEEPPDLVETNRSVSPALERIVRHCLEKNPEQRFHSASDVGFDLESLSASSDTGTTKAATFRARRSLRVPILAALVVLATAAALFFARRAIQGGASNAAPQIQQLTFRRGTMRSARFAPDGRTVIYSAAWEGNPEEIFTTSEQSPESRSTDIKDAEVLAVSNTSQLAIKQHPTFIGPFARPGTLAVLPLTGGAPRGLLDNVEDADFAPDGSHLAVVQHLGGLFSLQYPIGKVLYTSSTWLSHVRVSPDGRRLAFLTHPFGGDEGSVMLSDLSGQVKELASRFLSVQGLAWSPDGKEIWFTATRQGSNRALYAVSLSGAERLVQHVPGPIKLHDISASGGVLLAQSYDRIALIAILPGAKQERDLSWFDYSIPAALSRDGKFLLFSETGEGGGATYAIYLRPTDGSPAVKLGDGDACDLSPDGKLALGRAIGAPGKLLLLPTVGAPRELTVGNINPGCGRFLPDGHHIVFSGQEPGNRFRMYLLDLAGGSPPKPVTPEGVAEQLGVVLTPDGKFIVAPDETLRLMLYPVEGGQARTINGLKDGERVFGFTSDNRAIFVGVLGGIPLKIYEVDLATGKRQFWKEVGPTDPTGVLHAVPPMILDDGKVLVYGYERNLSELYLVNGLK